MPGLPSLEGDRRQVDKLPMHLVGQCRRGGWRREPLAVAHAFRCGDYDSDGKAKSRDRLACPEGLISIL